LLVFDKPCLCLFSLVKQGFFTPAFLVKHLENLPFFAMICQKLARDLANGGTAQG
jgi:hypothetical protein